VWLVWPLCDGSRGRGLRKRPRQRELLIFELPDLGRAAPVVSLRRKAWTQYPSDGSAANCQLPSACVGRLMGGSVA